MDHIKECERATIGKEQEEEEDDYGDDCYVHKVIFAAAGRTLAMACFKQFLVMFFLEQWRLRVFLVLNLILLAIFFTSIHSNSSSSSSQENRKSDGNAKIKVQEKKRNKEHSSSTKGIEHEKCHKLDKKRRNAHESESESKSEFEQEQKREQKQEHIIKMDGEAHKLSKEELNERVEAFITMFRQHLVSDTIKCRNQFISRPEQSELPYFHRRTKFMYSFK